MKLIFNLFITCVVIVHHVDAQDISSNKTIITGRVVDPSISKIASFLVSGTILRQYVQVDVKNSSFIIEYDLTRPMQAYFSPTQNISWYMYLKPGRKYEIVFDSANQLIVKDESVTEQNSLNYLRKKIKSYSYFSNKADWVLPVNEFQKKVENQEAEINTLIEEANFSDSRLKEMIRLEAKDNFITNRLFYVSPYIDTATSKWYAKMAPELKFPQQKIPNDYYDFSKKLEWNNPLLLDVVTDIEMTLTSQYIKLEKFRNPSGSVDYGIEAYRAILKQLSNEAVYNAFAFQAYAKYGQVDELWMKYKDEIIKGLSDKKLVEETERIYLKRKIEAEKIAKLRDIPRSDFVAYDVNDNPVSLKHFEGKLVLLDFWGTWCGPCVYEIPYLEKLQKEYENKNIVFVSLDFGDAKMKWIDFLEKKQMGGVQLYCGEINDNEILNYYSISGFPTFMLLDKSGKIIEHQMPRPSSNSIRQVLDKYITE